MGQCAYQRGAAAKPPPPFLRYVSRLPALSLDDTLWDVLQPPIVPQRQDDRSRHDRPQRERDQSEGEAAAGGVLDQPEQ